MGGTSNKLKVIAALALLPAVAGLFYWRERKEIVLDLARDAPLAAFEAPFELVLFGTPAAEAHQASGFFWGTGGAGEDGYAWAAASAELSFRWEAPGARTALLDMAPYPGLEGTQTADVRLNDSAVGHISLDVKRRRYAVRLPAEAQRVGLNRLEFVFAEGSAPRKPHRARMAAVFYSVAVMEDGSPALEGLGAEKAPPPLSVEGSQATTLVQVGPSAVRHAFRLPERAELRFTPGLHPGARSRGGGARLRVVIDAETGGPQELWHGEVGPTTGPSGEISVRLPGTPGSLVRLSLEVAGERLPWAVWFSPRILGSGGVSPLAEDAKVRGASPARPPSDTNVILVILDAAGARHFSCYGYERPTTPEIDRIASEGIVFDKAYSPVGFTVLAMSSIWTARHPDQHHNGVHYKARLADAAVTLPEVLARAGIVSAGWVDNPFAGTLFGLEQGFTSFENIYKTRPHRGAEVFHDAVGAWLAAHKQQRFFAYVHFREPHFPYDPQPEYAAPFGSSDGPITGEQRRSQQWVDDVNWRRHDLTPEHVAQLGRLYDGNLRYVDHEVGRLRKSLEEQGLLDRTLLIIAADHGDALYEHGFIGHMDQVYEDIIRIPLVVRLPKGMGPAGARVAEMVDLMDLAPTIAWAFGLDGTPFGDRTLVSVAGGAPGRRAIVSRTAEAQPKYSVRHERFKYIYHTARGAEELYDVEADPVERKNLVGSQSARAAWYRQWLQRWILEQRRGPRATGEEVVLGAEDRESLRALGYVQ